MTALAISPADFNKKASLRYKELSEEDKDKLICEAVIMSQKEAHHRAQKIFKKFESQVYKLYTYLYIYLPIYI